MSVVSADFAIVECGADDPRLAARAVERVHDPIPAGARCLLALRGGEPAAQLAWQVVNDVRGVPGPCGLVGWYDARDAEAGTALLWHARKRLRALGARRVLGPMNESTWGAYRLALRDPETREPPFLTEPWNPEDYSSHFGMAGFRQAAQYESRIVRNLAPREGEGALAERLERAGVAVRALNTDRLDADLGLLFAFSTAAFGENLYYRPSSFAQFREGCLRLAPVLDPELVRLAFDRDRRLLGFVLAFPDPLAAGRVVLKTVASRPGPRCRGLSAFLADQVHALARRKGYRAVIHALMHADNDSLRISRRYRGEVFRRYALYEVEP